MKQLKNKSFVFVVMRHDFDGKEVVIACSASQERAYELEGEFQQEFIDKGVSLDESYFYTVCTIYYV